MITPANRKPSIRHLFQLIDSAEETLAKGLSVDLSKLLRAIAEFCVKIRLCSGTDAINSNIDVLVHLRERMRVLEEALHASQDQPSSLSSLSGEAPQ